MPEILPDRSQYPWERAIVIGASSGIGEAIVRRLGTAGVSVALVARREDRLKEIAAELNTTQAGARASAYAHDVRDWRTAASLFNRIASDLGGVDLVVYASGIMPVVGEREYPTDVDVDTIETNLVGAVAWLNAAAARFDVMGEGTIVGLSSVAGDRGRSGNVVYGATKAALDAYLESLRARLAQRGVTVLTVKPGYTRTALVEGLAMPERLVSSADIVAQQTLAAAARGTRVAYTPSWWRWIMLAVRAVPAPLFERLRI